jgi:DNA end-binding protein Ku
MARPVWKGHISFGLVNVPVVLYSAEQRADLSFRLIDSRNSARVRYERINEETGEEVPWDKIVKGYEYDDNNYVFLSEDEMERASVELTRTIEIQQFVDLEDIDVRYFDRPYLLVPDKHGQKGYVLLREAIASSGRAGIATVVIRARQYLAALTALGDALVLELLRYSQELRELDQFDFPSGDLKVAKVTKKEIELASQLIDGMTATWDASQYHDEYRDVLMKLIEKKIKSGQTEAIELDDEEEPESEPQTIDFMEVLKQSVAHTSKGRKKKATPTKKKASARKKKPTKRRAG